MAKQWICTTDATHCFTESQATASDYFCTTCPPYSGVLMESDTVTPAAAVSGGSTQSGGTTTPKPDNSEAKKGVGLYIFLIDSSGSMFSEPAFPNSPMKRAKLVSGQVASAIFEMKDLSKKEDAYLFLMLFDHRLKPFINFMNVKQVFDKYGDIKTLETTLYKEMESMNGATDINLALNTAYFHAQKFINGEMETIGKIEPMSNSVMNPITGDDKTFPNVRCLIFTDGENRPNGNTIESINGNPFADFQFNGKFVNVLMGAYHGSESDTGFNQLKSVMGNCHIHGIPQFFHFSEPSQTMRMKELFRMGSGPAGFCEKCLDKFITDKPKS